VKELRMTVFLLVTTTVCTLLLAGANAMYELAFARFNVRLYGTILDLFSIQASPTEVESVFAEHFETKLVGSTVYYISTQKQPGTVVFKSDGPGLWSRIELLLAVDPDRRTLYGMRVLSQAETPGLGGRISEPAFQEAFRGLRLRPAMEIVKFAMADNQVDAISGATRTGDGVEAIVNRGIAEMDQALGEVR
jgi:Na+-transporting NADH:ubiquinone oxidoreductase subunit C